MEFRDFVVNISKRRADQDQYEFVVNPSGLFVDMNARRCYAMVESFAIIHTSAQPDFQTDVVRVDISGVRNSWSLRESHMSTTICSCPIDVSVLANGFLSRGRYQGKSYSWYEIDSNPFVNPLRVSIRRMDGSPIPALADEIALQIRFRFY
jgi:hypothetical protein